MENLNVVIHYFWVVKYVLIAMLAGAIYRAVVIKKLKSTFCNIIVVILLVLNIVSPVKLQIDTKSVHVAQDKVQEVLKVVPPKVEDKSFNDSMKDLKGISKEDLK